MNTECLVHTHRNCDAEHSATRAQCDVAQVCKLEKHCVVCCSHMGNCLQMAIYPSADVGTDTLVPCVYTSLLRY